VALAVQQSLFEAGSGTPMVESARWIEGVILGEIALGVCIIAVAFIGGLMLTGRLPLREGMRVVVGCFVLLGAPVIAGGFATGASNSLSQLESTSVDEKPAGRALRDLPPANYDPYSGATLETKREDANTKNKSRIYHV
jgi:type IV secretory pathway VirB2 component (pilin)